MSANSIVQRTLTNRWLHECDFALPELIEEDRDCRPWINGPKATGGTRE